MQARRGGPIWQAALHDVAVDASERLHNRPASQHCKPCVESSAFSLGSIEPRPSDTVRFGQPCHKRLSCIHSRLRLLYAHLNSS